MELHTKQFTNRQFQSLQHFLSSVLWTANKIQNLTSVTSLCKLFLCKIALLKFKVYLFLCFAIWI